MATATSGLTTRVDTCNKHGRVYVSLFVPGARQWTGQCEECAREEELARQASEFLTQPEQREEMWRRIVAAEAAREAELQTEVEGAMEEERPIRRAEWEAHLREEQREQIAANIEEEMRSKLVMRLKNQAVPQIAAER